MVASPSVTYRGNVLLRAELTGNDDNRGWRVQARVNYGDLPAVGESLTYRWQAAERSLQVLLRVNPAAADKALSDPFLSYNGHWWRPAFGLEPEVVVPAWVFGVRGDLEPVVLGPLTTVNDVLKHVPLYWFSSPSPAAQLAIRWFGNQSTVAWLAIRGETGDAGTSWATAMAEALKKAAAEVESAGALDLHGTGYFRVGMGQPTRWDADRASISEALQLTRTGLVHSKPGIVSVFLAAPQNLYKRAFPAFRNLVRQYMSQSSRDC